MADDRMQSLDMDGALSACRDVLRRGIDREGNLELLREPLLALSSCARRERVPPERVLVQVKQLLRDLTAFSTLNPTARDAVQTRVVQMLVAAYYADPQ